MLTFVAPIRYISMVIALFAVTIRLFDVDSEMSRQFIAHWLDFSVQFYLTFEALYWAIKYRQLKELVGAKV